MLGLRPAKESAQPLSILCLGCHSDDIEIGCGGTLLRLAQEQNVHFHWVVFTGNGVRHDEARRAADLFTAGGQLASISLHTFRDGFLPYTGAEVKNVFEELKQSIAPDII